MLLALEFFRIGELAAGSEHAALRFQRRRVRAGRLGRQRSARRRRHAGDAFCRLGDLHAGDEPFQVTLLFRFEIAALACCDGFEVRLAHSAGTRVGAVSGAGAAVRGLWVM